MFSYTVAIRTLGKAGDKYLTTLKSAYAQTISPTNINVYIPFGYDLPEETIGVEKYYRCTKGMVAQRALQYAEIDDEWILFLDDDMFLPKDFIQRAVDFIKENDVDLISANVFPNHEASLKEKIVAAMQSVFPMWSSYWGFKVTRSGRYLYNNNPKSDFLHSQTGSGNCILCRKRVFIASHFEDELWMDKFGYALGDDQLMNYKIFITVGGREYVWYNSGVVHLNAGSKSRKFDYNYIRKTVACLFLVWHRSIYSLHSNSFYDKFISIICYSISWLFSFIFSFIFILKGIYTAPLARIVGLYDGIKFIKNTEYKNLKPYDQ